MESNLSAGPSRVPQVQVQIDSLRATANNLEESVADLTQNLRPVITDYPEVPPPNEQNSALCELANTLREIEARIQAVTERVRNLIGSLEL